MSMQGLPISVGATHIVFDTPAAERLVKLGATNIVRALESLLMGPSRRDPLEHTRTRERWFSSCEECSYRDESGESFDRLYSSDVRWEPPVVLWVTESLDDRVNLWRTCSWLRQQWIRWSDVLVVEFQPVYGTMKRFPGPTRIPPFDCCGSVAHHPDEVLLDRLGKARPWPVERCERAVRLWESYVDENPLPFVESCTRGVEGFPELTPLWGAPLSLLSQKNHGRHPTSQSIRRASSRDPFRGGVADSSEGDLQSIAARAGLEGSRLLHRGPVPGRSPGPLGAA
ncbi:DUF1835 domain-containing protein [Sorangium sp. So ce119]